MLSYIFHMVPGREDVGYLIRPIRSDSRLAFEQVFQMCHNLGSSLLLHTFMSHSWQQHIDTLITGIIQGDCYCRLNVEPGKIDKSYIWSEARVASS